MRTDPTAIFSVLPMNPFQQTGQANTSDDDERLETNTLYFNTKQASKRSQNTRLNTNNKKHHDCVPHEKNKLLKMLYFI